MNVPQTIILPNGQYLINPVSNQYVRLEIVYTPEMLQFFNYLIKKFENPLTMKFSSYNIIYNLMNVLYTDKCINYLNIAIAMFKFAIKIKGCHDYSGKRLFGFWECGFVGRSEKDLKNDFILKFSDYISKFYFNHDILLNKYIYAINNFNLLKQNQAFSGHIHNLEIANIHNTNL